MMVPCKGKLSPFTLALKHDDKLGEALYIYWSRRTKFPHDEDNDGLFEIKTEQRTFISINSGSSAESTNRTFNFDNIYIAVYNKT